MQKNSLLHWEDVDCWQLISTSYGSAGSSVHFCRLVRFHELDHGKFAFKNMCYALEKQSKGSAIGSIKMAVKSLQQINTQYLALQMLGNCKRVVKLHSAIIEDFFDPDHADFFYGFLRKTKNSGISNVCLLMDFCDGGTLQKAISQAPLTEEVISKYACQVFEAIYAMHSAGITHRDLRSSNILIHQGSAVVSDFDSAFIRGSSSIEQSLTGINQELAAPQIMDLLDNSAEYLSLLTPDELYSRQDRSDLFSLGALLYEMMFAEQYSNKRAHLHNAKLNSCRNFTPNLINLTKGLLQPNPNYRLSFPSTRILLCSFCPTQFWPVEIELTHHHIQSLKTICSLAETAQTSEKSDTVSLSFGLDEGEYQSFSGEEKRENPKALSYNIAENIPNALAFRKKHATNEIEIKRIPITSKENNLRNTCLRE